MLRLLAVEAVIVWREWMLSNALSFALFLLSLSSPPDPDPPGGLRPPVPFVWYMLNDMKQVVALHGGNSFASYKAYVTWLRKFKIKNVEYFKPRTENWKASLPKKLGKKYQVLLPLMPNKQNAKYLEWKIWFERIIPFLRPGVILVGHSLGAAFLAKYLSEEKFPKRISGTFLVAGPYDLDGHRVMREFALPASLTKFEKQGGKIFLYHSKDDPSVPFPELTKYQKALPKATIRAFKNRQHFNQTTFPELVRDILEM